MTMLNYFFLISFFIVHASLIEGSPQSRSAYFAKLQAWLRRGAVPALSFPRYKTANEPEYQISKPEIRRNFRIPSYSSTTAVATSKPVYIPSMKPVVRWTLPRQPINVLDILFGSQTRSRVVNLIRKSGPPFQSQSPFVKPATRWRLPYIPASIRRITANRAAIRSN